MHEAIFNSRNTHICDEDNPQVTLLKWYQQQFAVSVWAGTVSDHLTGLYLLSPTLNDIQTPQIFTNPPLSTLGHMIIDSSTDVAPVRGSTIIPCSTVYNCFDATLPQHWIGWGGPISWPLQKSDLTPFGFFLWGQVKTVLYNSPTKTAKELTANIMGALQIVQTTPGLFSRVHQSMLHDDACAMCLGGGISNIFCKNLTDSCSRFMTMFFWVPQCFLHWFSLLFFLNTTFITVFYYTSIHVQTDQISNMLLKVHISQ